MESSGIRIKLMRSLTLATWLPNSQNYSLGLLEWYQGFTIDFVWKWCMPMLAYRQSEQESPMWIARKGPVSF